MMSQFNKNKTKKDGYKTECRDCVDLWKSSVKGKASRLYASCKRRTKLSKGTLTITKDWIEERLNAGVCEITGLPFNFSGRGKFTRQPYGPSIDRKDPQNPNYTPENSRVVLWAVNCTMAEYGMDIMLPILKAIVENVEKKPIAFVSIGDHQESQSDTQHGIVSGTGSGKDCDGAHHSSGAQDKDLGDSPTESSAECVGAGVPEVGAPMPHESEQDNGKPIRPYVWP